jgi:hypothetical protein
MIINKQYFECNELKFRGIKKETFKYIDFFEEYIKKHSEKSFTFQDFLVTLGNHLFSNGFSHRKIEKWFKQINNNIQNLAKEVLLKKYEKV